MKFTLIAACLAAGAIGAPLAFSQTGNAPASNAATAPRTRIVLPTAVVPLHYAIEVTPDAPNMRFAGKVQIDVDVREATRSIVLNAAALDFDTVQLRPATNGASAGTPKIVQDAQHETVSFDFANAVAPGRYTLEITYRGRISNNPAGLFALDYKTADQKPRRALFTQFENTDARRFVPCWDEPGIKATYTLTAVVPKNELAVSNMPIARSASAGPAQTRVEFQITPKMSIYLLFFAVGDLERAHRQVGNIDLGLIVKRGATENGKFALDAGARLLNYYNNYFGIPFPLPKMDFIGGPGVSEFFGAMENWGAVFYFENALLLDPRTSTLDDKQTVFSSVAHELAHQWFGDLVTMAWWDDVWLNEGFATWMQNSSTDALVPEWTIWLRDASAKQEAMKIDAAVGTHPIITPIHDVAEAANAFDSITYLKGAEVIRMLEAYVGREPFRDGVRRYMKAHAYGNAVTDELWKELDAVSPRKITDIAHDFTLHAGVPLVSVDGGACENGSQTLQLRQSRFAVDESGKSGVQVWRVPLVIEPVGAAGAAGTAGAAGNPRAASGPVRVVVSGAAPTPVKVPFCGPAFVNAGQTSYVRVRYSDTQLASIADRLESLPAVDQLGLLNDTSALAETGQSAMSAYLALVTRTPRHADPVVWTNVTGQLRELDMFYQELPGQKGFRTFASQILRPVGLDLGWDPKPGESDNVALQRQSILRALGIFGDAATVAEARRRFAQYLKTPDALTAATRELALGIVARHANPTEWEQIHTLARAAHNPQEQLDLYGLLGLTDDISLFRRMQELTMGDELPSTLRPVVLRMGSNRRPRETFEFAVQHWNSIEPLLEPNNRFDYLPRILQSASDVSMIPKLEAFNTAHKAGTSKGPTNQAIGRVRYNASVRGRLNEVDRWLAARANGAKS